MDIINQHSASRKKFLQIQIRINTFLDNLIETMGTRSFPNPVVPFFNQYFQSKQFLPTDDPNVLSQFEMQTLNIDPADGGLL